jgi:hypothetical protein
MSLRVFHDFLDSVVGLLDYPTPPAVLKADGKSCVPSLGQVVLNINADVRATDVKSLVRQVEVVKWVHLIASSCTQCVAPLGVVTVYLYTHGKYVPTVDHFRAFG